MLPDSFKKLKHLQYVNLGGCINLTFTEHNADILENITKLEYLSFSGCKGLQVLPHHITKQAFLRELDLEGTSFSELPSSIDQLERLEVLKIGSEKLESLPDTLGNLSRLTFLEIRNCEKVESLPDSLGNLSSLTDLWIGNCKKVRFLLESLGRLSLLKSINIWSTEVESLPKAFGQLISLQFLDISDSPIRELFYEFEESSSLPRLDWIRLDRTRMSTISIPEEFCPSLESVCVSCNEFLEEIRTLPRTVKTIELLGHKMLKDIAGISSLRNLQRLQILICPKLAELPSFAELASMKAIRIEGCPISGRMEGLEQLTSLETLEVSTRWEVPGITSLEHAQGLRRLRLSADKIGAVEGCIKTLQKWPDEVSICARALGGVESVVKAFTFSNLMVVEADNNMRKGMGWCGVTCQSFQHQGDEEGDEDGCTLKYRKTYWSVLPYGVSRNEWRLRYPKSCLSHEATIVCFVINCLSQEDQAVVWPPSNISQYLHLREGKWVWIGVFSQCTFDVERFLKIFLGKENRVEMGVLATGEESAVKGVFYQVLDALKM